MRSSIFSVACALATPFAPAFAQDAQLDSTGRGCEIRFGGEAFSGPAMTTAITFNGKDWPIRWTSMGNDWRAEDSALKQHLAEQQVRLPVSQQEIVKAAAQVGDAWLVGTANRHYLFWGGLYRAKPGTEPSLLHGGNVLHIISHGDARFIVVGSQAIRGTPPKVFALRTSGDVWSLDRLADLPEAPHAWAQTDDGVMLFATDSGALAVSPDGAVAEAMAKESCDLWTPAGRTGGLPFAPGFGQQ